MVESSEEFELEPSTLAAEHRLRVTVREEDQEGGYLGDWLSLRVM